MVEVKLNVDVIKKRFNVVDAPEELCNSVSGKTAPPGHIFQVLLCDPKTFEHYLCLEGSYYLVDISDLDGCWEPVHFFDGSVQAWVVNVYFRLKNKYKTPKGTVFRYPDTAYPSFVMSTQESESYQQHLASEASLSDEELSNWADPEHFCGYLTVKEFYPDHTPDLETYRIVHGDKSDKPLEIGLC